MEKTEKDIVHMLYKPFCCRCGGSASGIVLTTEVVVPVQTSRCEVEIEAVGIGKTTGYEVRTAEYAPPRLSQSPFTASASDPVEAQVRCANEHRWESLLVAGVWAEEEE